MHVCVCMCELLRVCGRRGNKGERVTLSSAGTDSSILDFTPSNADELWLEVQDAASCGYHWASIMM